jgi:hypothetical protein
MAAFCWARSVALSRQPFAVPAALASAGAGRIAVATGPIRDWCLEYGEHPAVWIMTEVAWCAAAELAQSVLEVAWGYMNHCSSCLSTCPAHLSVLGVRQVLALCLHLLCVVREALFLSVSFA